MLEKILVLGWGYDRAITGLGKMIFNSKEFTEDPKSFGLVMFTGGSDVSPEYYGDTSPANMCQTNEPRDKYEKHIFDIALKNDVLMTGICRGIQFLNVMAGGRMMHHVDGHAGGTHTMNMLTGGKIDINSLHHQMVLPNENAIVVGWSDHRLSKVYIGNEDKEVAYSGKENESVIFPEFGAFGVQYHPEIMYEKDEAFVYYYEMVKNALTLPWERFIDIYTKEGRDANISKCIDTAA